MSVDVSELEDLVREAGAAIADRAAEIVLAACRDACPVSTPSPTNTTSGQLRDSLEILDTVDEPDSFTRSVGSLLDYAQYTDDVDTSAHLILPNFARALRFYWQRTGNIEYRASVWHPGTTGTRWFSEPMPNRWEDALNQATEEVDVGQ